MNRLSTFLLVSTLAAVAAPASAKDQIRILCPTWSGYAPVFVAKDKGYFDKMGLDVTIKFDDERADVMAAMAKADIEMDMRTIGEYQGRPRDDNTPGVMIGTIDQSLGGDGVLAEGSIKSVAELKGKVVASEPNIPGRLLLQLALKKEGLSLADLKVKQIATGDTVAVFADSSINAVVSYQPYLSQALKNDVARSPKLLISSKDYPEIITDVIIVRADDLKQNPAKYRNFLIGVYKAIEDYKKDPADFIKIAAPHYSLSAADFKASIDGSLEYTDLAQTSAYFGTPGAKGKIYSVFDTLMGLNLENGAASNKLSADKAIDPSVIVGIKAKDLD
jgi:NitT/TauT family transport system substrate-binding protein